MLASAAAVAVFLVALCVVGVQGRGTDPSNPLNAVVEIQENTVCVWRLCEHFRSQFSQSSVGSLPWSLRVRDARCFFTWPDNFGRLQVYNPTNPK